MIPYRLEFTLPGLPKTMNTVGGSSNHWTARAREARLWKNQVILKVVSQRPAAPLKKAVLTLTRASSVRPDYDNLVSSFKRVVDGLVVGKIIEDDGWDYIGMPAFHWIKAPQGRGFIHVIVESA